MTTTVSDTVTLRASAPGSPATLSLPQEIAEALGMKDGATLRAVQTPDGLLLSTARTHAQAVAEAADRAEAQYENAFRELAK